MTRTRFETVRGPAIPLMLPNVDTDVIIRVERMTSTNPEDLAPWAFEALRYRADGTPDPSFVLNDPRFAGAPTLIAGSNFGCGSSREPAVWAIIGIGVQCIIAPSFGDIFRGNCLTNGILPVILGEQAVTQVADFASSGSDVTIDLESQQVAVGDQVFSFEIGEFQRTALLEGLDDIDLLLRYAPTIAEWEDEDRQRRPWVRSS